MSKHHPHSDHEHKTDHSSRKKRLHHDWRFWTAIVLMLVAMGIYVATMDEALQPGGQAGPEIPAAAE